MKIQSWEVGRACGRLAWMSGMALGYGWPYCRGNDFGRGDSRLLRKALKALWLEGTHEEQLQCSGEEKPVGVDFFKGLKLFSEEIENL